MAIIRVMMITVLFGLSTLSLTSSALSLPELAGYNISARAAALATLRTQFINGPRFHKVANLNRLFKIPNGPQPTLPVLSMISQEIADISHYSEPQRQTAIANGLSSGQANFATIQGLKDMFHLIENTIEYPIGNIAGDLDQSFADDRLRSSGFMLEPANENTIQLPTDLIKSLTGKPLKSLLNAGLLYKIDLSVAESANIGPKYTPGAIAMFFVDENKGFQVLGIRLIRTGMVYTPLDEPSQWQMAKMAFAAAEQNIQPMAHFVSTHLAMEPIRVAMMRHISVEHPIYPLLSPHFKNLFGNSFMGLQALFQNGTVNDSVFGRGSAGMMDYAEQVTKTFDWSTQSPKQKYRQLMRIPNFPRRDDSLDLYEALRKFVSNTLQPYYSNSGSGSGKRAYTTDERVVNDFELQAWVAAVADPNGGAFKGFPSQLTSFNDLCNMIATMIFQTSIQHHAMNSYVLWTGALPFNPKAFWAPLPIKKQDTSINLRQFLPPVPALIVGEVVLLSNFYRQLPTTLSLIGFLEDSSPAAAVSVAIDEFKCDLQRIHDTISVREDGSARPYTFLSPYRLPYYVWI